MAGLTHVYRRGAVYWWRRRVPTALVPTFGRPELRFSLSTHIRRDAAHRAARLRVATDVAFGEVERCAVLGMRLTPQGMKAIVDELVRGELELAERARALAPPRTPEDVAAAVAEEERRKAAVEQTLALRHCDAAVAPLQAALARAGVPVEPGSDDHRLLLRLAARGLAQVHRVNAQREQGIYEEDGAGFAPAPVSPAPVALPPAVSPAAVAFGVVLPHGSASPPPCSPAGVPSPPAPAAGGLRISEAARLLVDERSKSESWRSNMRRKYLVSVRLFIEAFGDLPLAEITKDMVVEFRELVKRLPRAHGKSARERRTIREIAEALDEREMEVMDGLEEQFEAGRFDRKEFELRKDQRRIARLGPTAVNLHVDRIKAIFDDAIERKLFVGANPAAGVRLSKPEQRRLRASLPAVTRLPWGEERLQGLFTSTAFTGALAALPGKPFTGDPLFWAPLAAAHMGLREEEILQTQVADIEVLSGVPAWRIKPGPGKKLKTENAERDLPIHRLMIEAGFLELVEMLRKNGETWLFPEIDRGAATGRFTDLFTKRFRRYRDDEGLYDPQRDFHALRKDFNVALRGNGVYWAARRRLLGHALDDVTDERYDPEGESMKVRRQYVDSVDYGLGIEQRDGKVTIVIRAPQGDAGDSAAGQTARIGAASRPAVASGSR